MKTYNFILTTLILIPLQLVFAQNTYNAIKISSKYDFGQSEVSGIEMQIPTHNYNVIRGWNGNQLIGSIHWFDDSWGGGSPSNSAGTVNIDASNAVTLGAWNDPIAYFRKSDGFVGIGTTAPESKLHVNGDIRIPSTSRIIFGITSEGGYGEWIQNHNGSGISLYTNFASRLTIANDGNVGIGAETPAEKLHIDGSVRGNQSGALRISTGNGYVDIGPKDDSGRTHFNTDRSTYYFDKRLHIDEGIISSYDEDLQLQTSGTTKVTILNSNGNVGIGTTNPTQQLDVNGILQADYIQVNSQPDGLPGEGGEILLDGAPDGMGGTYDTWAIDNLSGTFRLHKPGELTYFNIAENGNVGIGTMNTFGYRLAVNGAIGAKGVTVEESSPWPDFVFKRDYTLPTLKEVEAHIKENGHLKDIPSEAEVKENGINLGEMDAKLLQKIEELTLYTIEQEKTLKQQQEKIQKLETENEIVKTLFKEIKALKAVVKKLNTGKLNHKKSQHNEK